MRSPLHQETASIADKGYMHTFIRLIISGCLTAVMAIGAGSASATQWVNLKKTSLSTLMIDKQSITEQAPHVKAWVKVEYRTPQKNVESVDRMYNNARALWYFDCTARKAATVQVFQYEDQELVYSAGIDPKQADFVEPLPESEVEIAQQYVCQRQASEKRRAETKAATKAASAEQAAAPKTATGKAEANPTAEPAAATAAASDKKSADKKPVDKNDSNSKESAKSATSPAEPKAGNQKTSNQKSDSDKPANAGNGKPDKHAAEKAGNAETTEKDNPSADKVSKDWRYSGEHGPEKWGKLSTKFDTCSTGKQQSPINLDNTIPAALKPLKKLQKFPLKSIRFQDHSLVIESGAGNMMVLDQKPYQLKTISIHIPSEHQVKQKSFAGELHMLHEDKAGHQVMLSVLVDEGEAHPYMEKLLGQLPKEGESKPIAMRITPADLMPAKQAYYRYSGSLTMPPCTEGVQWIVMKEPIKLSKAQIEALLSALGGPNHRPVQDTQGRMILE